MVTCKTVTYSCIDTLLPAQERPLILSFFSVVAAYGTLKLRDRRAQWICAAFA
ncbi:MAG: hypothetical protein JSR80_01640 [Verrucomicrobia bacterium]|nr:hypothetical protein [Verrucomicrobiota bacterium]